VLELAAVEGLTSKEISQRLAGELSPSSVHTVLYRIRRQLSRADHAGHAALGAATNRCRGGEGDEATTRYPAAGRVVAPVVSSPVAAVG
jgi:hypothetical protein